MSKSINLDAEDRRVRFLQDLLLRKSGRGADGAAPAMPAAPAARDAEAAGPLVLRGAGPDAAGEAPAPAAWQDGGRGEAPSAVAAAPAGSGEPAGMPAGDDGLAGMPAGDDGLAGMRAGDDGVAGMPAGDGDRAGTRAGGDLDGTVGAYDDAEPDTDAEPDDDAGDALPYAPIARIEQVAPNPDAPSAEDAAAAAVAAADQARAARRSKQRTRTRLIGFDASSGTAALDPLAGQAPAPAAGAVQAVRFPVGWIVVIDGAGRGASFPLSSGLNQIGRGEEQQVRLDFGDDAISRENHASIAFDEESRTCYLGHGGKTNLVRRNGRPVLSTEELGDGDVIRVGETTLKFKALCGADFSWSDRSKVTRLANG